MYSSDNGLDELVERRGEAVLTYEALAETMRTFIDLHPETETTVNRFATFLARDDTDD